MSAVITDVLSLASAGGINLLGGVASVYAIVDATTGSPIIVPDTIQVFGYKNTADIPDYPIEQGGFNTYNKVRVPRNIRILMTCAGLNYAQQIEQTIDQLVNSALGTTFGQGMQRSSFCDALDAMVDSLDQYSIVTPDKTYANFNCISVSYDRTARSGAGMIKAECIFREIIPANQPVYSNGGAPNVWSDDAGAANPVGIGTGTTSVPNAVQLSQIQSGGFA